MLELRNYPFNKEIQKLAQDEVDKIDNDIIPETDDDVLRCQRVLVTAAVDIYLNRGLISSLSMGQLETLQNALVIDIRVSSH